MMKVIVSTEQFKKATWFSSNENCPLAIALKEAIPGNNIKVLSESVYINGTRYDFEGWTENWLYDNNTISVNDVDSYIIKAQAGEEVPSYEVEIIGYEP